MPVEFEYAKLSELPKLSKFITKLFPVDLRLPIWNPFLLNPVKGGLKPLITILGHFGS